MDKTDLKALRTKMQDALNTISGFKITIGNCRYDETTATFNVDVLEAGSSAPNAKRAREEANFKIYAPSFGLKPTDLNRSVEINGRYYRIVGLNPRCSKFPLLLSFDKAGVVYKFPVAAVKEQLDYQDTGRA